MVDLDEFYKNAEVLCNREVEVPLGKRLMSLLDEVVERLPDEWQLKITGMIRFDTRQTASSYLPASYSLFPSTSKSLAFIESWSTDMDQ